MRRTMKFTTILSILISFNLMAEESYKAPRLKMTGAPGYQDVKVEAASDWDSSYRVEEKVEGDRSIASDSTDSKAPKKAERNPSSAAEAKPSAPAAPAMWKYDR